MEVEVVIDERLDEEVRVVVARLVAQIQLLPHAVARASEGLGLELIGISHQEVVVRALGY